MNRTDWLTATDSDALSTELRCVRNPRKLFFLGAAVLRRVWDLLPTETSRTAVETTEQFALGKVGFRSLLLDWTNAEEAVADGLWMGPMWCECCDPHSADRPDEPGDIYPGVREAARNPTWFAARASFYAADLVGDGTDQEARRELRWQERDEQYALYRDIVGDIQKDEPRDLPCAQQSEFLLQQRKAMDGTREIDSLTMSIVGDALEEAGCTSKTVLDHCREKRPHGLGCWVVELLTGRAARALALTE